MNPNTCLQNKLTQLALKGLSNILQTSKRENKACNVRLFKLTVEKAKHPNFEWRGGVWIVLL